MNSNLLTLYHKRLDNLANTIDHLHQVVAEDQALSCLTSPQLLPHRIDRVNELVKDILNSEKEQIIIVLLTKIQQLSKPNQQLSLNIEVQHYSNSIESQSSQEIQRMKEQIAFERHTAHITKLQLKQKITKLQEQISLKQEREKCLRENIDSIQKQSNKMESIIDDLKKELNVGKQQNQKYRVQIENSKLELTKMKELVELTYSESKDAQLTIKAKTNRIDSLKAHMFKLTQELDSNKQKMQMLRKLIGLFIKKQLGSLKQQCNNIKNFITREFKKHWQNTVSKTDLEENELFGRMEKLEQSMNKFLKENQST